MSICKSVVKFDAVPPCHAAPPVTLDQGHRLSRTPRSFLPAARVFLSGLLDSSPFQEFLCAEKLRSFSLATVRWFTAGRRVMATNRKARVAEVYQLFISNSIKPTPPGEVIERAQQKVSIVTYKSNNYT